MYSIFDETTLAGMKLKNRLFHSATWVALTKPDGTLPQEFYDIYRELAAGGTGTIVTELSDVSERDAAIGTNNRLYSDALVRDYRKLVDIIHSEGANAIPQLNMNRYVRPDGTVVEVDDLTEEDLFDIRYLYISAAVRFAECGFDAVQCILHTDGYCTVSLIPQETTEPMLMEEVLKTG